MTCALWRFSSQVNIHHKTRFGQFYGSVGHGVVRYTLQTGFNALLTATRASVVMSCRFNMIFNIAILLRIVLVYLSGSLYLSVDWCLRALLMTFCEHWFLRWLCSFNRLVLKGFTSKDNVRSVDCTFQVVVYSKESVLVENVISNGLQWN